MSGHRKMARALNQKGYNLIRLPRADFAPYLVLGRAKGELSLLGRLDELMLEPPEALPALEPVAATGFEHVSTGSSVGRAGLSLLDGLLDHLGLGQVGASGAWSAEHEVELNYEALEVKQASMATVSRLIRQHPLDVDGPLLRAYLQRPMRKVFIVSAVLYSRRFMVSVRRSADGGGHAEVPLQELGVDAQVEAGGKKARAADVLHEGDPAMAIAFQCFELSVDRKGRMELVNAAARGPLSFAEPEEEEAAPEPALLVEDDGVDL